MKELINIQSKLKAPKNQYNSFGKYKYRSAEDILEALKPLLEEQECTLTITDKVENIGTRFYIVATATITNGEGKSVSVQGFAREAETKSGMDSSQITGSCSSYARKYALNGLFLIDDTKDADTDEQRNETQKRNEKKVIASDKDIEYDKELVLADIKTKTTRDELVRLWNDCMNLQKEKWFVEAFKKQGTYIKQQAS